MQILQLRNITWIFYKFPSVKKRYLSYGSASLQLKNKFRLKLENALNSANLGGGLQKLARQHEKGKLTARERILLLLDEDSFQEYDKLKTHRCSEFNMVDEKYYGDGVVTGHGTISGRKVTKPPGFIKVLIFCFTLRFLYLAKILLSLVAH